MSAAPRAAASSVFQLMERCRLLGHPRAYGCRRQVANGAVHLCFWCEDCERPVTRERYEAPGAAVSEEWLRRVIGIRAADLPSLSRDVRYRLCSRCGNTAPCEMHHIAPRAV